MARNCYKYRYKGDNMSMFTASSAGLKLPQRKAYINWCTKHLEFFYTIKMATFFNMFSIKLIAASCHRVWLYSFWIIWGRIWDQKDSMCPFYPIYYKKSTYKRIIYKPWNKIKIKKQKQNSLGLAMQLLKSLSSLLVVVIINKVQNSTTCESNIYP